MGKLEVEVPVKSSADKFWGGIKDSATLYPTIFPEIKSIEVLQGDGISVGSVRLVKYHEGAEKVTFAKENVEAVDEANKLLVFSVVDGELTQLYKSFKATVQVVPKGDGSLLKWSVDYEKAAAEVPDPDMVKDYAVRTFTGLDAYLLKA